MAKEERDYKTERKKERRGRGREKEKTSGRTRPLALPSQIRRTLPAVGKMARMRESRNPGRHTVVRPARALLATARWLFHTVVSRRRELASIYRNDIGTCIPGTWFDLGRFLGETRELNFPSTTSGNYQATRGSFNFGERIRAEKAEFSCLLLFGEVSVKIVSNFRREALTGKHVLSGLIYT